MREILASGSNQRPIVIVDHQGKNGLDAAAYFMGHGLESVRCLRGGIDAWAQIGGPGHAALSAGVRRPRPGRASGCQPASCSGSSACSRSIPGADFAAVVSRSRRRPPACRRGSGNFPPPGFLEARSQIKNLFPMPQEIYPAPQMEKDHRFIVPIFISSCSGGGADGCRRVQGAGSAWLASATVSRRVPARRKEIRIRPSLGTEMLGEKWVVKNFGVSGATLLNHGGQALHKGTGGVQARAGVPTGCRGHQAGHQ